VQYSDQFDKFELMVPEGWISGEGQAAGARAGGATGARRAVAWYPESDLSTNVSLIITNVGADFTKLGSFGTAQGFAENLVASMDRKFMKKAQRFGRSSEPVQEARLLASKDGVSNGSQLYYVDYALRRPGEDQDRIFLTAVSLGFNGRYNRFFTLTAQTLASDYSKNEQLMRKVVNSFKPPAPVV